MRKKGKERERDERKMRNNGKEREITRKKGK
jgi:hypothetical protein